VRSEGRRIELRQPSMPRSIRRAQLQTQPIEIGIIRRSAGTSGARLPKALALLGGARRFLRMGLSEVRRLQAAQYQWKVSSDGRCTNWSGPRRRVPVLIGITLPFEPLGAVDRDEGDCLLAFVDAALREASPSCQSSVSRPRTPPGHESIGPREGNERVEIAIARPPRSPLRRASTTRSLNRSRPPQEGGRVHEAARCRNACRASSTSSRQDQPPRTDRFDGEGDALAVVVGLQRRRDRQEPRLVQAHHRPRRKAPKARVSKDRRVRGAETGCLGPPGVASAPCPPGRRRPVHDLRAPARSARALIRWGRGGYIAGPQGRARSVSAPYVKRADETTAEVGDGLGFASRVCPADRVCTSTRSWG